MPCWVTQFSIPSSSALTAIWKFYCGGPFLFNVNLFLNYGGNSAERIIRDI